MRTAFKCRAYPAPEQAANLARTFGCVRKVWNETLAWRHQRWYGERLSTNVPEANAYLTAMKRLPELAFLSEVSSVPLQQVLRTQQKAFVDFFAQRARYPRFKSRAGRQSAEYTRSAFRWRDGRLYAGRHLIVIDRWYPSSKTCSNCGHLLAVLSLGTRHWTCPACGTRHDRDENAAKNILAAGLAVAPRGDACGGDVSHTGSSRVQPPTKQEPPAARPRTPVLQGGE